MSNKIKFINVRNSKNKLNFTIKKDEYTQKFIIYVYDDKSNGIIRVLEVPFKHIFKVLAQK